MSFTFTPFAAFRRLSTSILVVITACSAAFAQITVTNATFPTAGTTLRTAMATNPGIAASVFTPPGGNQVWDLSGLQQGTVKTTVFKAASEGSQAANVPGAELVSTSSSSPVAETYYNVTSSRFETQAVYDRFYDVVPLYLSKNSPPLPERSSPMNFFDISQATTGEIAGSNCIPVNEEGGVTIFECSFSPTDLDPVSLFQLSLSAGNAEKYRYRVSKLRKEVVDAWGTMTVPGGTYNVLRMKRTEITEVRFDGKYNFGGSIQTWLDITDQATSAGFQRLGTCTTYTTIFVNDVEKEPIAVVSSGCVAFDVDPSTVSSVEYKLVAPQLSINNVTLNEGNSGTTNFNFTVSISAPAPAGGVSFDISTQDGTTNPATQPSDYTTKSLTSQTIPAGSSTYNFTAAVNGDGDVETDEIFFVNVSNVTGATVGDGQGLGTITNDDVASCSISSASFSNVSSCNNNGTPANPADDFYTADLTVNFSTPPATGTLRIEPGNPNVLGVVEIAVGSITGSSHTFTGVRLRTTGAAFAVEVEFSSNNACVRTIPAPAVGSCSAAVCSISSASFSNVSSCNNNGTPANPADDFYTADLTVNFSTPPTTGTLRIEPGNPNVLGVVEIAVGSITGSSHTFTGVRLRTTGAAFAVEVEFSADNACVRTFAAPAVASCSAAVCSISSASFSNISSCNNNGTPANPADDFYTADLTVNFSTPPATGTLRIEPGNVNVLDVVEIAVGSLTGSAHTFTGVRLRTTGAAFAVEVEFSADNACVRTVAAPAVGNCAVICVPPAISAPTVTQPNCILSTGTIVVNATGNGTLEYSINGGTTWSPTATFSGLVPGNYNIAVRLQSNLACVAHYSSNPVVLTAAKGCVVVCPKSKGYWKNHPSAWPASALPMMLGTSRTYTKQQLRNILNMSIKGDASLILAHQLIAAKLNIAAGATAPASVTSAIIAADAAIRTSLIPMNVRTNTTLGKKMTSRARTLESFNTGQLNTGCGTLLTTSTLSNGLSMNVIPENFELEQNYPNPFSSVTTIRYVVPVESTVSLTVYNNQGQLMAKLADGRVKPGNHQVRFDASKLAAGIYLYRLQTVDANGQIVVINKKMILSK